MEALQLVRRQAEPDTETATWLNTALVSAMLHTGRSTSALAVAADQALAGALAVKLPVLELQARWGRCPYDMFRGEYVDALEQAGTLMTARSGEHTSELQSLLRNSYAVVC